MKKIKYSNSINMKLKEYFSAFGLRYDLREAKKFLMLDAKTPRPSVIKALKGLYHQIEDEYNAKVYSYTLTGTFYELKSGYLTYEPQATKPFSINFQSINKYTKRLFRFYTGSNLPNIKNLPKRLLTINDANWRWNEDIIEEIRRQVPGSEQHGIFDVEEIRVEVLRKLDKKLKNVKLFREMVFLPDKQFNGFKDTGNSMCVPETLIYHLKKNDRNKKVTLTKLINQLNEFVEEVTPQYIYEEVDDDIEQPEDPNDYDDDFENELIDKLEDDRMTEEEAEELRKEHYNKAINLPEEITDIIYQKAIDESRFLEGKGGYTGTQIIKLLELYNCKAYLIDFHQNVFLQTEGKRDKHLPIFVGMIYNNHLYYCEDADFCKRIAEKGKKGCKGSFDFETYVKECKTKDDEREYEVCETSDLLTYYIELFKSDRTIRRVKVLNGNIVSMNVDNKVVCANPEKSIMIEMLGDEFKNQNTTTLGKQEFDAYFNDYKLSNFRKEVQDQLLKLGGKNTVFNEPSQKLQSYYDINKCRTACLMDNQLGSWEIFGVESQIEKYNGKITKGLYFVETDDYMLFNGNGWYSGDFIKVAKRESIQYTIKYQLLASSTLNANYFEEFVKDIVKKYPTQFKHVINKLIGNFGKTRSEVISGYIEPDKELAVAAFWDNNDQQIGFLGDKNIDKKIWKIMKGNFSRVRAFDVSDDETHYIVEAIQVKTLYENSLPIYNKVIENEYLRLYTLAKNVGGRVIKFATDAVIVEGGKSIELSDEIGGYKLEDKFIQSVKVSDRTNIQLNVDTTFKWSKTYEKDDYTVDLPNGSFVVTGLAGFGKSYFVKQLPEFSNEHSIRLAFSNVATENLQDEANACYTINSYFGINCMTGKCSEKKINNIKNIKNILISECFMIPSYIMQVLVKIKTEYPSIKFILEGDPEQTRPVKEEHINWLETKALHTLCDGNLVILQHNKRNNETPNYHKIMNGDKLPSFNYEFREPQQFNICRTNKMRRYINHKMMDKNGLLIKADLSLNSYSQDTWLNIDMPIMCVKNNKKLNLKNGKRTKIEAYDDDYVLIDDIEFTFKGFVEHFVPAYCMTNHKIQGLTVKENFNIYEWDKMTRREQYTAYSRCTNGNNVRIVSLDKEF